MAADHDLSAELHEPCCVILTDALSAFVRIGFGRQTDDVTLRSQSALFALPSSLGISSCYQSC